MWTWLPISSGGGAAGDWTKILRGNEKLGVDELLVREVVQNSWDAASRHRRDLDEREVEHPEFRMNFRFVELEGHERDAFVAAAGLEELRARWEEFPAKFSIDPTFFVRLRQGKPIRLLYIEDFGTHGLYGPPSAKTRSHLFRALYFAGATTGGEIAKGGGGSFGFGKSAFIRSSAIQTVIAHTTFEPHSSPPLEDDATERLVGFTWWAPHEVGKVDLEGRAVLGAANSHDPFEDEEARAMARILGFTERAPHMHSLDELGTSLLVVGPTVDPLRVREAMERNWWPALVDELMDLRVEVGWEDEAYVPRPRSNPRLKPFLRAYEIATGVKTMPGENEVLASADWRTTAEVEPGSLGLVADESSDQGGGDEDLLAASGGLVALMRGPRMVVDYQAYSGHKVRVRGAFVASPAEDPILRLTEPVTHDAWSRKGSADIPEDATKLAKTVYGRLRRAVDEFAKRFEPEEQPGRRSLKRFSELMRRFTGSRPGTGPGTSVAGEPIELQYAAQPHLVDAGDERLAVAATIRVALGQRAEKRPTVLVVGCEARLAEDGGGLGGHIPVIVELREPDRVADRTPEGDWLLTVGPDDKVMFDVRTTPFDRDWTVILRPRARFGPGGGRVGDVGQD